MLLIDDVYVDAVKNAFILYPIGSEVMVNMR